jgi:hypothetical protein
MNQFDTILSSGLQDTEIENTQIAGDEADWGALFGSGYVLVYAT